ncbi:hypothetical protein SAMN04487950_2264 [Halogranum rubrum]|uniref:Uncharacterized protein n=1 Tax=Halogranum rubrum TaxID=553466 RepID=A0A1I4ELR6_9EURY|nr:hypothetical protein [Halogranum rubrum]SFL06692.1 hypothetical protein SAMN04487950_2264 [Halogranum rubrum]
MPSYSHRSAPLGLKIIAVVGLLTAIPDVLQGLGLLAGGIPWFVFGVVVFGVALLKVLTMFGLVTLTPWAWTVAVFLYGFDTVVALLSGQLLQALVLALVTAYIYGQKNLFRRGY